MSWVQRGIAVKRPSIERFATIETFRTYAAAKIERLKKRKILSAI